MPRDYDVVFRTLKNPFKGVAEQGSLFAAGYAFKLSAFFRLLGIIKIQNGIGCLRTGIASCVIFSRAVADLHIAICRIITAGIVQQPVRPA